MVKCAKPWFNHQGHRKQVGTTAKAYNPGVPLGRQRQEDQTLMVILVYILNLRAGWATEDLPPTNKTMG